MIHYILRRTFCQILFVKFLLIARLDILLFDNHLYVMYNKRVKNIMEVSSGKSKTDRNRVARRARANNPQR